MYQMIEVTDPLLEQIPIDDREQWIFQATQRLIPLLSIASYQVDSDGVPVDPVVRSRLRFAVASQALTWHKWGIDPLSLGDVSRLKTSASLGPASVTYDHRDGYAEQKATVRDGIDPSAVAWLRPLLRQPSY